MADKALEAKNKGNAAFQAQNYEEAVKHFTEAIGYDPNNHILYSNRSGAYASLKEYHKALDDAKKTVEIKPDWGKGYSRLGSAYFFLNRFAEAVHAYEAGLKVEPQNQQLSQGLSDAQGAAFSQRLYSAFQGDMLTKIKNHPKLSKYLAEPDFLQKIAEIQQQPNALLKHLGDERIAELITTLAGGQEESAEPEPPKPKEEPKPEPKKEEKKPEPAKPSLAPEQEQALKLKEQGNEFYKKKQFDQAIESYSKAIELEPTNFSFKLNRTAAYFEKGDYEKCLEESQEIVDTAKDFQIVARAQNRMGKVYGKQEKYAEAVEILKHSLVNHRTADTLNTLNDYEKKKKEKEDKDYINPALSLEEKEKGNEAFKKNLYPEAVKHYSDAIRRNPNDHTLYSNRAACYMKLMSFDYALRDCDQCIKLNPTFVKAYIRKGLCYYTMKDYRKSLEVYDEGLKIDGENPELIEGSQKAVAAIAAMQRGGGDPEAAKRAMEDPEIQRILRDQRIQKILSDPELASSAMSDPEIAGMIKKLVQAGIIRVG